MISIRSYFLYGLIFFGCRSKTGGDHFAATDSAGWPQHFGFGKKAGAEEIAAQDMDVRPDGKGLPEGAGNAAAGKAIYLAKCSKCHGLTGTEGPFSPLVTALHDTSKAKTIGNYWPYATTIFDYVRRAMPLDSPGSLTAGEVYHLTAFLLHSNRIIDSNTIVNAQTLPQIRMPAQPRFVPDDRRGGAEIR